MSQVLNVKNRIIEHPGRYKLTKVSEANDTYDLEAVTGTVTETGTPFNKSLMDKIDCIMKYNEVTGTLSSDYTEVNYNLDCLSNSNLVNNQRVLLSPTNTIVPKFQSVSIAKASTSIGTGFYNPQFIEMSNGNIMIVGYNYAGSIATENTGYFYIVNKSGSVVKSATSLGTYFNSPQLIEMSNGNIMVVGNYNNTTARICILDQSGSFVKSATSIGSYFINPQLLEMSNGNIMIVGNNSSYAGYMCIVDQSGSIVKSATSIGSYFNRTQLIEMSNGNIMIVGYSYADNTGYMCIVDQSGSIIKSATSIGTAFRFPQLIEMSNGNIMIVGSNGTGYICILDQSGNSIKETSSIGNIGVYPQLIEMSNGNIMVVGGDGSMCILDQDGDIIKLATSIGSFDKLHLIEMSNGYIMIVGYGSSYVGNICILDQDGNIVQSIMSIGNYFNDPQIIEMSNGNVMIVGGYYSSSTGSVGYITILQALFYEIENIYLNNVALDTLLEKNKYYELVYSESKEKFLAKEVRT